MDNYLDFDLEFSEVGLRDGVGVFCNDIYSGVFYVFDFLVDLIGRKVCFWWFGC